jgi:hypothetical protein
MPVCVNGRDVTDERLAIRDLIENWVVWRGAGDWERFRTVWHGDGRMMATWFQGGADDFIAVSREGFERLDRFPRRLPPPRLPAERARLHRQARHARTHRP